MRIDLSKWGPLSWLIVSSVVIAEVFIGAYLVFAQPSTTQIAELLAAGAALLGSPAVLALAHAILKGQELRADASSGVADATATAERPTVTDERELAEVVRPEAASTPDPVEGHETDPNARLAP